MGESYGGYIRTAKGVKLIEYNARFGDPEAINVLALLETDFVDVCQAVIQQTLADLTVNFAAQATVCKYIVPQGYPDEPMTDQEIDLSNITQKENIYFASVNAQDNKIYTTTSRALAVLGVADTIQEAESSAEVMFSCDRS